MNKENKTGMPKARSSRSPSRSHTMNAATIAVSANQSSLQWPRSIQRPATPTEDHTRDSFQTPHTTAAAAVVRSTRLVCICRHPRQPIQLVVLLAICGTTLDHSPHSIGDLDPDERHSRSLIGCRVVEGGEVIVVFFIKVEGCNAPTHVLLGGFNGAVEESVVSKASAQIGVLCRGFLLKLVAGESGHASGEGRDRATSHRRNAAVGAGGLTHQVRRKFDTGHCV